jgi:hypothetical protein
VSHKCRALLRAARSFGDPVRGQGTSRAGLDEDLQGHLRRSAAGASDTRMQASTQAASAGRVGRNLLSCEP